MGDYLINQGELCELGIMWLSTGIIWLIEADYVINHGKYVIPRPCNDSVHVTAH